MFLGDGRWGLEGLVGGAGCAGVSIFFFTMNPNVKFFFFLGGGGGGGGGGCVGG